MKNNRFRTHVLANILCSGLITCLIEVFLVGNLTRLADYMAGTRSYIHETLVVLLFVILGILIFTAIFWFLERRSLGYISEISEEMERMSAGDLSHRLEIPEDNELGDIAMHLNDMSVSIKELMDKEREAERTKNELITNVAHDLRTPLTSIIGYLDLLAHKDGLSMETMREYAGIGYTKARKLETLIEDLFGYTKLNYGKIAMNVSRIDLVKLLGQMMDEFYPSFEEKGISYDLTTNLASIMINADGKLIARLFDNLINNAIKYGADGKRIEVKVIGDGPKVTVTVTNYGKVIPADELPYIFDKFYRVEQSRSSSTGGTGLGLAIAKNIVQMHGGTITAESDLKGTRFIVVLQTDFDKERERFDVQSAGRKLKKPRHS